MNSFRWLLIFVLIFFAGCATTAIDNHYYKPLNTLQEDFYAVQSMFNSAAYTETISLGEKFLDMYPRDILTVSVRYYIGSSYQEMGQYENATEYLKSVLKTNPDDDWGKLARVALEEIKDSKI